jgi:DNA-binding MurR/RpiR family transcriptional regulator
MGKLDDLDEDDLDILFDSETWTAGEVADELGVSPSTIDRARKRLGIPTLRQIRNQQKELERQKLATYTEWMVDVATGEWTPVS